MCLLLWVVPIAPRLATMSILEAKCLKPMTMYTGLSKCRQPGTFENKESQRFHPATIRLNPKFRSLAKQGSVNLQQKQHCQQVVRLICNG